MSTLYKFRVSSRKITAYGSDLKTELCISVLPDEEDVTHFLWCNAHDEEDLAHFRFLCKFSKDQDCMEVKDVTLKLGASWQDMETITYLKGRFCFRDERAINAAMLELKNGLNGQKFCIDGLGTRWQQFHVKFCQWFFAQLKPCLEQEGELQKTYLKLQCCD